MKCLPTENVDFECNICGTRNIQNPNHFHREKRDCKQCGSTPRFRGTIFALSMSLFGKNIILTDFPVNKNIKGVGMSEWQGYADILAEKFDFQNTFYHMPPKLDITSSDWENFTNCDFVMCMEVMEHIPTPFEHVPINIHRMLKADGVLIFSTPFTDRTETKEHFPGLGAFVTVEIEHKWVVLSKDSAGYRVYDKDVCFHGGPGTVLEMRVFSRAAVLNLLTNANFSVQIHDLAVPEVGYLWPIVEERPGDGQSLNYIITARPLAG